MKKSNNNNGFTIIEVVLVLAIAGLIFLMVFIALPALQRSQADTQRRSDAGRLLTAVTNFETNNRGNAPTYADAVKAVKASNDQFTDPSGNDYKQSTSNAAPSAPGEIQYVQGAICNPNGAGITTGQGNRKIAVVMGLSDADSGNAASSSYTGTYCTSN